MMDTGHDRLRPSTSDEVCTSILDANESSISATLDGGRFSVPETGHGLSFEPKNRDIDANVDLRLDAGSQSLGDLSYPLDDGHTEENKLVVADDRPVSVPNDANNYEGTLFYYPPESTLYLVDESDFDSAIGQLPIELRPNLRLLDDCSNDGVDFANVVHVRRNVPCFEAAISEGSRTKSTFRSQRYDARHCRDDAKSSKNVARSCPGASERILMCLVCKLSFDETKPFVNHAVLRHELVLLKEEQESLETTSAVVEKSNSGETRLCVLSPATEDSGFDDGQGNSPRTKDVDDNGLKKQETTTNQDVGENCEEKRGAGLEDDPPSPRVESSTDMTPADIARTVMLASELSASRLLQQVSQGVRSYQNWNAMAPIGSSPDGGDKDATLAACGVHGGPTDGKSGGGVECPKCDVVLGSSRSLGGHMTMTHSRNSCKTLKCPKCNWHYKYPETLEIHMKEKHPENEVSCVYCITNQAHPRLSRGETYTCGYKPFRCDICKYSTTTKGNLSIHMQSDKHLNNVQELQQGKLMTQGQTPGSLAVLNFAAIPGQISPLQTAVDFDAAGKAAETVAMALAQACNSATKTTPVVKNKPSWRCDVCSYETNVARNLRIHMTSEKHAHNMNVLQQNMKQLQQTIQGFAGSSSSPVLATTQTPFGCIAPSQSAIIPKDGSQQHALQLSSTGNFFVSPVLNHSISSPTSQHPSSNSLSDQVDNATAFNLQAALLQRAVDGGDVFQCCVCMTFCTDDPDEILVHIQRDRSQPMEGDVSTVAGQYYCNLCRYKTHLKANFQLHTKTDKHLQRLQLVNHVREGCPENQWRLKYLNPNNPVQLRCCACNHLVNSFHKLQMHSSSFRHKCFARAYACIRNADREWQESSQITRQHQQIFHCTLCDYRARKNGMLNHLHSTLHGENVNRLDCLDSSDSVSNCSESDVPDWIVVSSASELDNAQLTESTADGAGNNPESDVRMNEYSEIRQAGLDLEWNQERICDEDDANGSDEAIDAEGEFVRPETSDGAAHCCSRCSCVYETEAELCDHYAASHSTVKRGADTSFTAFDDDSCLLSNRSSDKFHAGSFVDEATPNYNSGSSNKQRTDAAGNRVVHCPLCQKECGRETTEVETHLAQVHNVSTEGISRLLLLIPTSAQSSSRGPSISAEASPVADACERPSSGSSSLNSDKTSRHSGQRPPCPICSVPFTTLDELYAHQSEVGHIEMKQTSNGIGYLCWWKSCGQHFKTLQAVQAHVREIHAKRSQRVGVTSDRHIYRYRCGQCSQAFRTEDKLEQHQTYHQMRAATTCVICSRSFRSIDALKKHVENTHVNANVSQDAGKTNDKAGAAFDDTLSKDGFGANDQVKTEIDEDENEAMDDEENSESPLNMTGNNAEDASGSMEDSGEYGPLVIDEKPDAMEDYLNTPVVSEKAYSDASRRFKCHRCKVAFTRQSYLSIHNRTVAHRRGDKDSHNVEKYMDPNRPYKCKVCMESFTQKSILLVHNNSVMHMQKLKKTLQESYPNGNLSVDMLSALSKGQSVAGVGASPSPTLLRSQSPLSKCSSESSPLTSMDVKSTPSNQTTSSNKRYKCNTCDTFVTESTLEIHLRSVKHQSRAAKLPLQNKTVGEFELKSTSGERSDLSRPIPTAKQLLSEAISKRNFQHSSPVSKGDLSNAVGSTGATKATTFSPQEAAAAAAASFQSAAALFSMAGFGPFLAAAQAAGYQDYPGNGNAKSLVLECSQCKKTFQSVSQLEVHKEKCFKALPKNDAKSAPTACTSSSISAAIEQALSNSRRAGRGNSFKRLLEDYGFEVVMQFNEIQPQKRPKPAPTVDQSGNTINSDEVEKMKAVAAKNQNQAAVKPINTKTSLPELKKCVCPECGATFTSVWVLKAHAEQMHGKVVPLDFVEEISEEFKQAYEKKVSTGAAPVQQDGANRPITSASADSKQPDGEAKVQTNYDQLQNAEVGDDSQHHQQQQQQQLLALNAMMQHFTTAQFPAFAANPAAAAAAMGLSQFPFMGVQFSPFAVPNPFLPMMVPPSLDQLTFGTGASAGAITSTSNAATLAATAVSSSSISGATAANAPSSFMQPPPGLPQGSQAEQQKRARTRITDDQLKILREYFDINNSPTEEQIEEMSRKSGLALKVIKHWFRNTLFKERQRCKDSPYNFSVPPSYSIDLEQYEKTGEAKIIPLNPNGEPVLACENPANAESKEKESTEATCANNDNPKIKDELPAGDADKEEQSPCNGQSEATAVSDEFESTEESKEAMKQAMEFCRTSAEATALQAFDAAAAEETLRQITALNALTMQFPTPNLALPSFMTPPQSSTAQASSGSGANDTFANLIATAMSPGGHASSSGGSRRANRTRFTEYQIKTLQEFFEQNAYPKDDDLEYLSQKLALSPRVIVVWFQNARQKARKLYENQPDDRFQRTPGLNYQCKGCKLVFQRYYELIKHQQSECFKDEVSGEASLSPTPTSSASTTPKTSLNHYSKVPSPASFDHKIDNEYRCAQCNVHFSNAAQFGEHLKVHVANPFLFLAGEGNESRKRGFPNSSDGMENLSSGDGGDSLSDDQDSSGGKRQRTQILPEQLDALYNKYVKDTNPSSKNLEKIAQEVGLSKKVVQVWFQNTRARERRGQLNDRQFFNKRCPFCGILCHSKQTMEAHLNSRHAPQLRKTKVDIDSLPDAEEVPTITTVPMPEALLTAARSGVGGNDLAQSMLNFGIVPGTTTVPAPNRAIKTNGIGHEGNGTSAPLDLSRAMRPSSCEKGDESGRLGPPGTPSTGNSNEEAMSMDEFDDSRSAFDHDSPSPHQQVLAALARPQKRFRTHLTPQQVKVMKHLFVDYRTPTMSECETLGQELGLHKRVVQVWFQNARAKERKAKVGGEYSNSTSPLAGDVSSRSSLSSGCELCSVTYSSRTTMQDHLFSKNHLEKIKALAESEDDGFQTSPKYIGDQLSIVEEPQRPATARTTASSSSTPHQSRSQHKQQQVPQRRQQAQQQQQDISSTQNNSVSQNFLPYVYASGGLPQAYYAGLASMYANAAGIAGMYDPDIFGTPVNMLQIPPSVMRTITASMGRAREISCRFTQDGMTVVELSNELSTRDRAYLVGKDVEVGWACRRCTVVFRSEALFTNHQQMVCQTTEPVFKLIQTHYECRLCSSRFGTQDAFKSHCQSQEHVLRTAAN